MNTLISQLKIRVKLLLAFGSIILLSVLLIVLAITSINRIIELKSVIEEVDKLTLQLERIELTTKEFILEGYKSKDFQETGKNLMADRFDQSIAIANGSLLQIVKSGLKGNEELRSIADSMLQSTTIRETFFQTKELLRKRGFKDYGLEGSLRQAIHKIENSSYAYDRTSMLTLRRHEKDFFLRHDLKYQNEFNAAADAFRNNLAQFGNTEGLILLREYQEQFNQIVEIDKEIGLGNNDGKKGSLFKELKKARIQIDRFQAKVHEISEQQIVKAKVFLLIIFCFQFLTATVLAIVYSNALTSVIKQLMQTMRKLAEGVFPEPLPVKTNEEIGQTKLAINQFLERLRSATSFAEKLGTGDLSAVYDQRFNDDVLAKAIINMQHKLRETEAIQTKINWVNEGAARFNDIIKNDQENLSVLGDNVLRLLINYLGANQGALYILDKEEKVFIRTSTYAYGKKKFIEQKLDQESGLIGQCAAEGETIYLKEIPVNYVKITSGLGEATPKNVLIVPLKVRQNLCGVLELASFELFEDFQIQFVEQMGENIASLIQSRQITLETKRLLEESEKRMQDLKEKEEEMRQNAEELLATQEEMERQRMETQKEIKLLKEKIQFNEFALN